MLCVDRHIATGQPISPRVQRPLLPNMTGQTASPLQKSSGKGMRSVSESVKKANKLKEPISERELTIREKIILLEASKLHSARFPPWTSPPLPSEFEQMSGQPHFM